MQYYIYMRIFIHIQLNRGFGRWSSRATGFCNDAGHRCPGCWQPGRPSQYNPLNQPSPSCELNDSSPIRKHKESSRFHELNQSYITYIHVLVAGTEISHSQFTSHFSLANPTCHFMSSRYLQLSSSYHKFVRTESLGRSSKYHELDGSCRLHERRE